MTIQSTVDLRHHFEEHVGFLQASAARYDEGAIAEAKRLAVSIRVLIHDTRQSKSLLGQLGMKSRPFFDTSSDRPANIISSYAGLVGVSLAGHLSTFVPNFNTWPPRPVSFLEWWNGVVIADLKRREISRERLILAVANQDGGAHVDPELDDIYAELSRMNSMGQMHSSGGPWKPILGVDHASVRQIAHEVLGTLDQEQPAAVRGAGAVTLHGSTISVVGVRYGKSVGRNDPCPCGSGKKYKKCCGAP